jgi:hypothetical protein
MADGEDAQQDMPAWAGEMLSEFRRLAAKVDKVESRLETGQTDQLAALHRELTQEKTLQEVHATHDWGKNSSMKEQHKLMTKQGGKPRSTTSRIHHALISCPLPKSYPARGIGRARAV